MNSASEEAAEFFREIAEQNLLWAIVDASGSPAQLPMEGNYAILYWSSLSRAQSVINSFRDFSGFMPVVIDWDTYCKRWVNGLSKDGLLVRLNYSNPTKSGVEIHPHDLWKMVEAWR